MTQKRKIVSFDEFVFEDRNQLELPFHKKKGAKASIHDKPIHVHVLNALQDMSVMKAERYNSVGNPVDSWDAAFEDAFQMMMSSDQDWEDKYTYRFVYKYDVFNDTDKVYSKKFIKDNEFDKSENYDHNNISDAMQKDIDAALTPKGRKVWMTCVRDQFTEELNQTSALSTMYKSYEKDPKGLIDVWRAVDYVLEDADKDEDGKKFKDMYDKMTKMYKWAGMYWTWDHDAAQTYWGSNNSKKVPLILCGKVAVQDVDWVETVYKNGYYLNEEKEVRIKDGGKVLIYAMKMATDNYKELEMENPVVVPSGR